VVLESDKAQCVLVKEFGDGKDKDEGLSGMLTGAVYSFLFVTSDGKENFVRASKIDKMLQWINDLALVTSMAYDVNKSCWTKEAKARYRAIAEKEKERDKERESQTKFRSSSTDSTGSGSGFGIQIPLSPKNELLGEISPKNFLNFSNSEAVSPKDLLLNSTDSC
jgi:hypothetical protein